MASKARPWLEKGTHSATEQLLRRMGSLPVAMLSFASHCDAGNDTVVVYQPTMIPGARLMRMSGNSALAAWFVPVRYGPARLLVPLTIFLGALLLFAVEPLIAKMIL